jgi:hypothetical protein
MRSLPSSSSTRTPRRIDAAEVVRQRVQPDLAERAGQLDAGRAGADHHEGEPGPLLVGVGRALGRLVGQEHPAPDLQRVLDRLEARRVSAHGWPKYEWVAPVATTR